MSVRAQGILPSWLKQELPDEAVLEGKRLLRLSKVNTVCADAKCPNLNSCFKKNSLTFLILGNACTRDCRFCAVGKAKTSDLPVDADEPSRIIDLVKKLGLKYVVITSVTRDDLPDGGVSEFIRIIELARHLDRGIKIELLIPDFSGKPFALEALVAAAPEVIGHNIETVKRVHRELKPQCSYDLSILVLEKIKKLRPSQITKSSIMLGLGEEREEVINTMRDLRGSAVDILTLGQYLSPGKEYYPVVEFIKEERFREYRDIGLSLGFKAVLSGPKVRSSYLAPDLYLEATNA